MNFRHEFHERKAGFLGYEDPRNVFDKIMSRCEVNAVFRERNRLNGQVAGIDLVCLVLVEIIAKDFVCIERIARLTSASEVD